MDRPDKGKGLYYLFLSALFFSLDAVSPAAYLTFTKRVVPLWFAWASVLVGAVLSVLFILLYLRASSGLPIKGGFKAFIPALINGALMFMFGQFAAAAILGRVGMSAFLRSLESAGAGGYIIVALIACLVFYTTVFFVLVYLKNSAVKEAGLFESTPVYLDTLKRFFTHIYISLPASIVLGLVLTLVSALMAKITKFRVFHMSANLVSVAAVWLLQALIYTVVFALFFIVAGWILGKADVVKPAAEPAVQPEPAPSAASDAPVAPAPKALPKAFPLATCILIVLCVAAYFASSLDLSGNSATNAISDINIHEARQNIYLSGEDYYNAYYESRIALSENKALQAYIRALIINKNGQSDYKPANDLFDAAQDIYKGNPYIYLMRGRFGLKVQDNPDAAKNEMRKLEALFIRSNNSDIMLLEALDKLKVTGDERDELVSRMILNGYYYDTYSDLEKLSLKKLYRLQEDLEEQEKLLCESYYPAKAFNEMDMGEYSEAIRTLDEWVKYSDSVEANYNYCKFASQYANEGREYKTASERVLHFAELYTPANDAEALQLKQFVASVLIECNDFEKCENYLKNNFGENQDLSVRYAYALNQNKEYEKSISVLEKMLKDDSRDFEAIYLMARNYQALGNDEEALRYITKISDELAVTKDDALRNFLDESLYMFVLNVRGITASINQLDEYVEKYNIDQNSLLYCYLRMQIIWNMYYVNDTYDDFIETANKALAVRDDLYTVHYLLGQHAHDMNQYDEAIEEFNKAWAIDNKVEIPFQMGYDYAEKEMYGTAIRMWNRVHVELPVGNHNSSDNHGFAYHCINEINKLREHIGEVR